MDDAEDQALIMESDVVLMVETQEKSSRRWIIDSGSTSHLCPNKSEFTSYQKYDSPRHIRVGDARTIPSLGEGTVSVACIINGTPVPRHIHGIQYVPDLTYGLLSCSVLNQRGLDVLFEDGLCRIRNKKGRLIAESLKEGSLYFLNTKNSPLPDPAADADAALVMPPSFDLVHKRLAHPGKDVLQQMIKRGLANRLTSIPDDSKDFDCVACICRKMTWGPFQEGHVAAGSRLGRLHSDICGPMDVPSLGKRRYFCVLVDDKTGYLWFHACFAKSDFTPWFIKMDSLFANHYQSHVKVLRSDLGGEYVNMVLEEYCSKNGIAMELTVPHTPEQNGIMEHTNRRILDKGCTVMKDANAPDFLWADALATVVYAINRMAGS